MAAPSPNTGHWWLARPSNDKKDLNKDLAAAVTRVAKDIEQRDQAQRWRSYVYARLLTGRPFIPQFAFSMAKRPSTFGSYYGGYSFEPSRAGFAGMIADIYVNRLLSNPTYIEFLPDVANYTERQQAEDIDAWLEGASEDLRLDDIFKRMGLDAIYYGTGWLKFSKGFDSKVTITNPHPDELLHRDPDDPNPRDRIQRVWASKVDLLIKYGGKEGSPLYRAIQDAPSAYPYCWFGPGMLACDDVVALLESWRLPEVDGTPGRHCLVVGDVTLLDEKYTDSEMPFEKWDFHVLPSSINGQGLAEILLPISEEIDRLAMAIQESGMRCGYAKWMVEENSGVNVDALGDILAAAVKYLGTAPKLETPAPINGSALEMLRWWIAHGMNRAHISLSALQGDIPKALDSAVAIEKYAQISDANFVEMIGRLEETVKRANYQIVRVAKEVKPEYRRVNGTQIIKWEDLKIEDGHPLRLRGYNVGRLGQTVAGRQELLVKMLDAGDVDRRRYNKYLQIPQTRSLLDELNAPTEGVDRALDKLTLGKKYIPPSPYFDLDYGKQAVEARIILEDSYGTPRKVIDRLRMWRAAVIELIEQRDQANQPAFTGATPPATAPGAPVGTSNSIPGPPVPVNNPAEQQAA